MRRAGDRGASFAEAPSQPRRRTEPGVVWKGSAEFRRRCGSEEAIAWPGPVNPKERNRIYFRVNVVGIGLFD
uniref:Uncharacterized protein n=1 Tax=Sphaerodactylus townsendi TaxID=933632 RepID=A0ACB8FZ67_9SAUR